MTGRWGDTARGQTARADEADRRGDKVEAVASLGRSLIFKPSDVNVRLRYALALADADGAYQRAQALQILRWVLAREPGRLDAAVKAANLCWRWANRARRASIWRRWCSGTPTGRT